MGPSGAGAFGMAAYANVPTRPTNSKNALSERFIQLLSLGSTESTSSAGVIGGRDYTQRERRSHGLERSCKDKRREYTMGQTSKSAKSLLRSQRDN
jgi:hypothetical protein